MRSDENSPKLSGLVVYERRTYLSPLPPTRPTVQHGACQGRRLEPIGDSLMELRSPVILVLGTLELCGVLSLLRSADSDSGRSRAECLEPDHLTNSNLCIPCVYPNFLPRKTQGCRDCFALPPCVLSLVTTITTLRLVYKDFQ